MAASCLHAVCYFFGLYIKSLAQKLTLKFMYVTIAGHRSWCEMKDYI